MSMRDKSIRIDDWACNELYVGPYDSPEVDKVLDANKCKACDGGNLINDDPNPLRDDCPDCNGTGYSGDFEVSWVDDENNSICDNVYEYINY